MQLHSRESAQPRVSLLEWCGDHLRILDQRSLPGSLLWVECRDAGEAAAAIVDGVVQGSVMAGLVAAYGMALAARRIGQTEDWSAALRADFEQLAATQPASTHLAWVLGLIDERVRRVQGVAADMPELLAQLAVSLQVSDVESTRAQGRLGVQVVRRHVREPQRFLSLISRQQGGSQSAVLDLLKALQGAGLVEQFQLCVEAAPDAARQALWELEQDEVPTVVHGMAAAGQLMKADSLRWVVLGAQRIAANGDLIADVGSYALAVLAMHHGLRCMVVASSSAFDLSLATADELDVVEHLLDEHGQLSLDVTPADLIDVIVTERGVVARPDTARIAELLSYRRLH